VATRGRSPFSLSRKSADLFKSVSVRVFQRWNLTTNPFVRRDRHHRNVPCLTTQSFFTGRYHTVKVEQCGASNLQRHAAAASIRIWRFVYTRVRRIFSTLKKWVGMRYPACREFIRSNWAHWEAGYFFRALAAFRIKGTAFRASSPDSNPITVDCFLPTTDQRRIRD
jgi:hypothetical protein